MAVNITHSKVATLPDEPGAEVNKAEWNDVHVVAGLGTAAESATTDFDAAGTAVAGDAAHVAAPDPHPQYLTAAEGNAAYDASGAAAAGDAAHVAAVDPHTQYQKESEKDAANGYAGLSAGTKLSGTQQTYGSAANTACEGNDARLSDSRTPTAHATSHKSGGSDPIKLDELAAPTDVTTLNVSTTAHGLTPKLPGGTATFFRADGSYAAPTATASDPSYSPGSVTVATETSHQVGPHIKFTGSQRLTIQGTARLSLQN